jgi:peptidoglycan/xylan/chitin deacetylase (PgdA/CDA1 family)
MSVDSRTAGGMSWLAPVAEVLDTRVDDPCPVFFRDDDAGWGDARLFRLLDLFEAKGVPVDVAVIPDGVSADTVNQLGSRAARGAVALHQHGWSHTNHERTGRKCEFGPSRSYADQSADIVAGRTWLLELFGDRLDPIFTPPWNRCTTATARAAAEAGLTVLSRDNTAAPLEEHGLVEVPVRVDWFGHRKGVRWSRDELGQRIAQELEGRTPVGVMLHHAVTEPDDQAAIDQLLRLLAEHPGVQLVTIQAVAQAAGRRGTSVRAGS